MDHDDFSDIKMIHAASEKDFVKEYDEILENLADTNLDWNKRLNYIKRMQGLVLGGAYELKSFPGLMVRFHTNLNVQLNDLRSSINREACRLVCLIAYKCKESIEAFCEKLISKDSLIKLINNGNKLIAENGHQSIMVLLEQVQSTKIFPRILEEQQTRNAVVRTRIAQYLSKIFEVYPIPSLEKNIVVLEKALHAGVSDPTKETRAISRIAFKQYAEDFPGRAQKLFIRLDPSAQKMLNEEGVHIDFQMALDSITRPSRPPNIKTKNEQSEGAMSATVLRNSNKSPTLKREELKPMAATDTFLKNKKDVVFSPKDKNDSMDEISLGGNSYYSVMRQKPEVRTPEHNRSSNKLARESVRSAQSPKKFTNMIERTTSPNRLNGSVSPNKKSEYMLEEDKKRRLFSSNPRGGTSRIEENSEKHYDLNTKRTSSSSLTTNILLSSSPLKNKITTITESSFDDGLSISMFRETRTSNLTVSNPNLGDKLRKQIKGDKTRMSTSNLHQSINLSANAVSPKLKSAEIINLYKSGDSELNSTTKEKMNFYKHMKEEDLSFLLESCNAENWATRCQSFEKIMEFVGEVNSEETFSQNLIEELIKTHVTHVSDPHIKVSIACMASFTRLVAVFPNKVKARLPELFPSLIDCMVDSREKLRSSANFLVNVLYKAYSGDDLIEPCLQSIDKLKKSKGRISVLEVTNMLVRKCSEYFESQYNIRQVVNKMAVIMSESSNNSQIILPALGILIDLRDRYFNTVMAAILELSNSLQTTIRSLSCQYAPDLENTIREYIFARAEPKVRSKKKTTSNATTQETVKDYLENYQENSQTSCKESNFQDSKDENLMSSDNTSIAQRKINKKLDLSHQSSDSIQVSSFQSPSPQPEPKKELAKHDIIQHKPNSMNTSNISYIQLEPTESIIDDSSQKSTSAKKNSTAPSSISKFSSPSKAKEKESLPKVFDLQLIERMIELNRRYRENKETWSNQSDLIISNLFNIIKNSGPKVSDLGLDLLLGLLELPLDFATLSFQLVNGLTEALHLFPKNPKLEEIWSKLLSMKGQDRVLGHLIDILPKEDHPVLQILIKYISILFYELPSRKSEKYLPPLFEAFQIFINSANPDIRKVVVFNIVDLYAIFGASLQKYIDEFSQSQQKLISIYIKRKLEKNIENDFFEE